METRSQTPVPFLYCGVSLACVDVGGESSGREEEGNQEEERHQTEEEVGARTTSLGIQPKEERNDMPKAACPVCGKNVTVDEEDAVLYERVTCPHCDTLLEIIDEDPMMLDEIFAD